MLEIIAGIGHHRQASGCQHSVQAEYQLGSADATGKRDNAAGRRLLADIRRFAIHQRNMSSDSARISVAAATSSADQRSPRTITTGSPSSAWPISNEAAAAISSAK